MNLSPPPIWQTFLLEEPLSVVIVLVGAAVVLRILATRQRQPRLNYAAVVALVAAMGVFILAHLVVTDREQLMQRTEALVAATAPLDRNALADLIANGAIVTGPQAQLLLDYEQIRPELEQTLERYPVEGHSVRHLAADTPSQTHGRSVAHLSTQVRTAFFAGPVRSEWALMWDKQSDGVWRVVEIQWLKFQGSEPPTDIGR